jgi:hypothetical protein
MLCWLYHLRRAATIGKQRHSATQRSGALVEILVLTDSVYHGAQCRLGLIDQPELRLRQPLNDASAEPWPVARVLVLLVAERMAEEAILEEPVGVWWEDREADADLPASFGHIGLHGLKRRTSLVDRVQAREERDARACDRLGCESVQPLRTRSYAQWLGSDGISVPRRWG